MVYFFFHLVAYWQLQIATVHVEAVLFEIVKPLNHVLAQKRLYWNKLKLTPSSKRCKINAASILTQFTIEFNFFSLAKPNQIFNNHVNDAEYDQWRGKQRLRFVCSYKMISLTFPKLGWLTADSYECVALKNRLC